MEWIKSNPKILPQSNLLINEIFNHNEILGLRRAVTNICANSLSSRNLRLCEHKRIRIFIIVRIQLNIIINKLDFQIIVLRIAKFIKVLYNFYLIFLNLYLLILNSLIIKISLVYKLRIYKL